jgi:hypothetical protein
MNPTFIYPCTHKEDHPMPRKTLSQFLLILIIISFSSCATLIHGSRQNMFLTCEPRVASVYVDGKYAGSTPMNVGLSRGRDHQLRIELQGYKPFEATLTRRLDGWVFGNLLLVGIAVDAVNGSMYRLSPRNIYPELTALPSDSTKGLSIRVMLQTDEPHEKWKPQEPATAAGSASWVGDIIIQPM